MLPGSFAREIPGHGCSDKVFDSGQSAPRETQGQRTGGRRSGKYLRKWTL